MENSKIAKHRRLKFGALAIGLTAAVIALIVIVNAIFSALAQKYLWIIDMTDSLVFSISEQSKNILDPYRSKEDSHIDITFCMPADELDANYYSNLVHNLALQYEEEFDFVHVNYVDIINHPDGIAKYLTSSVDSPKTTSVIISDGGTDSRLIDYTAFYTYDQQTGNIFAFNGEYKYTSSMLQLLGDSPIAYFTTGHGEKIDEGKALWTLMEDAGFDVRKIDLTKDPLDKTAKLMVINNPLTDFIGDNESGTNEIKKIDDFLNNYQGGLMVFMGSETGELPELDALLAEWGIKFEPMQVIDYSNAIDVDGKMISATYTQEGTGSSITTALRELESTPKAIVKNARPITLLYERNSEYKSDRYTSTVLTTSPEKTAIANPLGEGDPVTNEQFNLMTITLDQRYIDNEAHLSFVLATGSGYFGDDEYTSGSKSYANRDIMFYAIKAFARKTVPLDLKFKVFSDTKLNITKAEANRYTALITVVPALIVAGIGIYVYTRRRYL